MGLTFCCEENNDLYRVLKERGYTYTRCGDVREALLRAPAESGVLLLADRYPRAELALDEELLAIAADKKLRVYAEYPAQLAGLDIGESRPTEWERVVVASEFFAPAAPNQTILAMHGCWYMRLNGASAGQEHLVAARVAGYDSAVFGLPEEAHPILLEWPERRMLVAFSKLSQFVTGRYGPSAAWRSIWERLLHWLSPDEEVTNLEWTPDVGTRYGRDDALPQGKQMEADAFRLSAKWFRMNALFGADGHVGAIEGFVSQLDHNGRQLPRAWRHRADCICETAMVFAYEWTLAGDPSSRRVAGQLLDLVWSQPEFVQENQSHPAYGLVNWYDRGAIYYGDDNARVILATWVAAQLLNDARWEERVFRCLLANLRTTGRQGFRRHKLRDPESFADGRGWRYYQDSDFVDYAPHYQAYLWACYLWGYASTGYDGFLQSAKQAIRLTMDAYPDRWRWTNGLTQEIARMLLPLALLVRVEDTAEHRGWLNRMVDELLAHMQPSGAIAEWIGPLENGVYTPPVSNESYGTREASLLQTNGDPVCDLLYTANFAFLGLHEAAVALGEKRVRNAADRLAEFLCRIQIASVKHRNLDGAWMRSFDFAKWEYWGSSADAGWGAWCVETGWTNSWIAAVMARRQIGGSLFEWKDTGSNKALLRQLAEEMLEGV